MKKRNIDIKQNSMKLIGAAVAMSLLFSATVYAEELDDFVNSEDITTMSEEIDTLGDQVDTLNENNSDDELSDQISTISDGIGTLDGLLSSIMSSFNSLKASLSQYKSNIISALNSNVYAQNNISSDASFEDVVDKINDINYKGTVDITLDSKDTYTLESGYYDGGTIDVSALYEAARQEGYEAGKQDGKKDGYNEAIEKEKDKWVKTGYDSAINAEKDKWINEGIGKGHGNTYKMRFNGATSNKNKVSGTMTIPKANLQGFSTYTVSVDIHKGANLALEANGAGISRNTKYRVSSGRDLEIYARLFSGEGNYDTVDMTVTVTLE
ncbi:hypothetical protein [Butyrivibrio sp. X503]|uniref:hypothetical protein n=1 Tax=Butyrivibrio sp. X503 TaxID=2364878 RepID=UPI000EA968C7|nr:hypothetical protein [Butyrivibrio sp. X503]